MGRLKNFLIAASAAAVAAAAMAAETISYSYDAQGRLRRVVHQGSINNGVTTNYAYDAADNLTNKVTSGGQ